MKLALPVPLRVAVCVVMPPPESVTVPVDTAVEVPVSATVTATVSGCVVVMLDADGVTVTFGVVFVGGVVAVTITTVVPLVAL